MTTGERLASLVVLALAVFWGAMMGHTMGEAAGEQAGVQVCAAGRPNEWARGVETFLEADHPNTDFRCTWIVEDDVPECILWATIINSKPQRPRGRAQ